MDLNSDSASLLNCVILSLNPWHNVVSLVYPVFPYPHSTVKVRLASCSRRAVRAALTGSRRGIALLSCLGFRNKGRDHEEAMACCRRWLRALHKRRGTALSQGPTASSAASVSPRSFVDWCER
jgi:hypothetical protein